MDSFGTANEMMHLVILGVRTYLPVAAKKISFYFQTVPNIVQNTYAIIVGIVH
jgi:hypothetical protein